MPYLSKKMSTDALSAEEMQNIECFNYFYTNEKGIGKEYISRVI